MSEILTYSGIMFDPLNPDPDLIRIKDIAHALSLLCRANGHFPTFYSVAQHSIACCREAAARGDSPKIQLACLLHDASEAYLSDVTRPVKAAMPLYLEMEAPLQNAIWNKWLLSPLTEEEYKRVFEIDDALLYHEFLTHTGMALADAVPEISSHPRFAFEEFGKVEQEFLGLFNCLMAGKVENYARM